jgi:hypothetical protein
LTLLLLLLNWDDGTCRASSSSPRNETVSQEPRLFLSLSNLDSSFFLDYFPLEEFFRILPNVERWGENVLIPLYTVCVCTQGTGYPVRQTTSHRILYRGDGKTNWTDCIKAAKKVDVDFKKTFSTTGCWVGGCRTLTAIWWRQLIRLLLLLPSQFFSPKSQSVTSSKSISP